MKISWEFFKLKRGIKLESWAKTLGITNYEQFVRALDSLGVEAPSLEAVQDYFKRVVEKEAEQVEAILSETSTEVEEKPAPEQKRRRKRSVKKVPDETGK